MEQLTKVLKEYNRLSDYRETVRRMTAELSHITHSKYVELSRTLSKTYLTKEVLKKAFPWISEEELMDWEQLAEFRFKDSLQTVNNPFDLKISFFIGVKDEMVLKVCLNKHIMTINISDDKAAFNTEFADCVTSITELREQFIDNITEEYK